MRYMECNETGQGEMKTMERYKHAIVVMTAIMVVGVMGPGTHAEHLLHNYMTPPGELIASGENTLECIHIDDLMAKDVLKADWFADDSAWGINYGNVMETPPEITVVGSHAGGELVLSSSPATDASLEFELNGEQMTPEAFVLERLSVNNALCWAEKSLTFESELFQYSILDY